MEARDVSQFGNNDWSSNQRCLTLLDPTGNTDIPGDVRVHGRLLGVNNTYGFVFPIGSFKMLYHHPGGAAMLPPGYIDNTTFIDQMKVNFNQIWVTVARNTTWGTLRMDIVQRNG